MPPIGASRWRGSRSTGHTTLHASQSMHVPAASSKAMLTGLAPCTAE